MDQRGPVNRNWLLVLDGITDPVSRSREFTRRAMAAWNWPLATAQGRRGAEDALLLVSEVVANACRHGGGPGALVLDCTADRLRIEVTDLSPEPPVPPGFPVRSGAGGAPGRPGGYGLLIVERLARDWGWRPGVVGKCVWLEFPCPPGVGTPPPPPPGAPARAGLSGGSPARR
ncbi:ATP-binding protein [Streptomyces sp. NPDC096136]|uniref:ATP-binding protein n=1 Tax=Streptomyces sp. NPDC096136 TaxID=3366076 RepID=UPI0038245521